MSRNPTSTVNPPTRAPLPPPGGPPFVHYRPRPEGPLYRQDYAPVHHTPPPDAGELLAQRLSQRMAEILASHQAHSDARMNRLETNVQRVLTEVSSWRHESRESVVQIAEVLQKSHTLHMARLKRLENILGMGPDMEDQKTLLGRFDLLSFAVEELLERIKDPEANLPDGPLHHDMATSPFKRAYADAGVPPKSPSPGPSFSSVAVSSSMDHDDVVSEHHSFSTIVADETVHILHKELPNQEASDLISDMVSRPIPKTTFAAASPVTRSLVPADWHDQSPSPSPQRTLSFNPDRSPEGMEAFSALPSQRPPSEGTIASLREATLGNRFAGPLMSTPCRSTSVDPVSPPLSVSLPQSPRHVSPFLLHADDAPPDDHPTSPVVQDLSPTETRLSPARESSIGAHDLPQLSIAAPPSPTVRSPTLESDTKPELQSPSADTEREELSVRNMMSPQSDASPIPLTQAESQTIVPSSATPSPMLQPQVQRSPPPRLTLSIPNQSATPTVPPRSEISPLTRSPSAPPEQVSSSPNPADLFDSFMSPLSPSTASRAPSPAPPSPVARVPKREVTVPVIRAPPSRAQPSSSRPTVSVLRPYAPGVNAPTPGVKKRKAKPQSEPGADAKQEPPSKRARQRAEKQEAGPSVKQEKEKGRKKKKVVWPEITPEEAVVPEFVGKLIGCDTEGCDRWYHYTCLAIVPNDSRLRSTFYCPLCAAGHPVPRETSAAADSEECSRPGCPVQDKFYEATGIFGRHTKLHSTYGRVHRWLVFWEGYQWKDATWEPEPPSQEAMEEFNRRAVEEGIDLDDDSASVVMLAEAVEGGARDPEAEVVPNE
ncbi:hypothetical protein B0H19DRAFT_221039 [Mycena capillaripes]|nr:hypothetical protein B0H19DRAFT_221039 [Mycena capillaripes]